MSPDPAAREPFRHRGRVTSLIESGRIFHDLAIPGLDAGADRYLTKSSFHDETLLTAVSELIGLPNK